MKKLYKEKWLEALRSGKYEQGQRCLKTNDNRFCCLGVLCDVVRKTHKKKGFTWKNNKFLGDSMGLSHEVGDLIGYYTGNYVAQGILMDMNDRHDKSFKQIADYIEKNVPET